jgi:predicted CXXCH cytochrome family protein
MNVVSFRARTASIWPTCLLLVGLVAGCVALAIWLTNDSHAVKPPRAKPLASPREMATGRLTVWWDALPATVKERTRSSTESNIHPADYIGPQACKECHPKNHDAWSTHPHRWMNALASDATIKGDFSGKASISYLGGRGTFERRDGKHYMKLQRDMVKRTYEITQTIGSRFYQYYVGKQIEGPEPKGHHFYTKDHVLQFGYWLDQKQWVPIIHVGPEMPDGKRPDPFAPPESGRHYAEYAASCNYCHTTFPLADMFGRRPHQIGEHAPRPLHWSMRPYLEKTHPEVIEPLAEMAAQPDREGIENPMVRWDAEHHAATFGVSCEACHLGSRKHVESHGKVMPRFFPSSQHLFVESNSPPESGRTHDNVNWACGRCHVGGRPAFAAGMSTWNSVEYSDAMRGSCYSKLRCIDCHSPHQALGPRWTPKPQQDDAVCLKCHEQFRPAPQRQAHTHHPAGSEGARCLNCHMPRINEGIQDVVRTHMIYSPTRADMIEANHPNACNLCHTDKPIDWTLGHLKEWYGKTYDEKKIAATYRDRTKSVGLGWLESDNPAVRLVAVEALTRNRDTKMLPRLLDALDDPHLVNRQFAYKGLQGMLNLPGDFGGYRFYMTSEERRKPLAQLRAKVLKASPPKSP